MMRPRFSFRIKLRNFNLLILLVGIALGVMSTVSHCMINMIESELAHHKMQSEGCYKLELYFRAHARAVSGVDIVLVNNYISIAREMHMRARTHEDFVEGSAEILRELRENGPFWIYHNPDRMKKIFSILYSCPRHFD